MSNRVERASTFRAITLLGLAVFVLISFALGPSLYSKYLAWAAEGYCKSILNQGKIFPGAKSLDDTIQFNYCVHNPDAEEGACGYGETPDMVELCKQYTNTQVYKP